jgi:hypothetical protein
MCWIEMLEHVELSVSRWKILVPKPVSVTRQEKQHQISNGNAIGLLVIIKIDTIMISFRSPLCLAAMPTVTQYLHNSALAYLIWNRANHGVLFAIAMEYCSNILSLATANTNIYV